MVYDAELTESELRKSVERLVGHKIQDVVWNYSIRISGLDGLHEPYLEEDIEDKTTRVRMLEELIREATQLGQDIIPKKLIEVTDGHGSLDDRKTVGDPLLLSELRREELKNHPDFKEGREVAEQLRKALGFAEPIPLHDLKPTLINLGATTGDEGVPHPIPARKRIGARKEREIFTEVQTLISERRLEFEKAIIGRNKEANEILDEERQWRKSVVDECEQLIEKRIDEERLLKLEDYSPIIYWEIEYLAIPRGNRLERLSDLVLAASNYTRCHPALTLAFILCDVPFFPRDIPKLEIIKDGQDIQIHINQPEVSPQLLARQYREMRNFVLVEKKEVLGKWLRARSPAQKTITLINFIENNGANKRNWKHLLQSWNNNYPKWKYNDVKQMQLSYYKAKKRYR